MTQRKAVLVVGAGDAAGGAITRQFAYEGYVACVTRCNAGKLEPLVRAIRDQGDEALAYGCDARQEQQVVSLFARIEGEVGASEAAIFNIGANVWFPITETTERVYHKIWEMAIFGDFLTGHEAAQMVLPRQRGTIIFTGATTSLCDRAHFTTFSSVKFALCALAQSTVRGLGPKGVHVAHPIISGTIDTGFIHGTLSELYRREEQDSILDPGHVAETYWQVHCQPRDYRVHELDLHPWVEAL